MTNRNRQKLLDINKWRESEKHGTDLSGKMKYCDECPNQIVS
jgi:hypothetical protein